MAAGHRSGTFLLSLKYAHMPPVELSVLNNCRGAHGAGYQHGNHRGCLKGTRNSVLAEIERWSEDHASPAFWLNGLARTGKYTTAQTISEKVFADSHLGASFFCSRGFEDHSNLHLIFPILAFQLAHKYPTSDPYSSPSCNPTQILCMSHSKNRWIGFWLNLSIMQIFQLLL